MYLFVAAPWLVGGLGVVAACALLLHGYAQAETLVAFGLVWGAGMLLLKVLVGGFCLPSASRWVESSSCFRSSWSTTRATKA